MNSIIDSFRTWKRLVLSLILFMTADALLLAKVWIVDNQEDRPADFRSAQAAMDSTDVMPGDTILVRPSSQDYGNLTFKKRIHLIGGGFHKFENYPESNQTAMTRFSSINFKSFIVNKTVIPASDIAGSSATGLTCVTMTVTVPDILIRRCKFTSYLILLRDSSFDQFIPKNLHVMNCYGVRIQSKRHTPARYMDGDTDDDLHLRFTGNIFFLNSSDKLNVIRDSFFENNQFLASGSTNQRLSFLQCRLRNNIFMLGNADDPILDAGINRSHLEGNVFIPSNADVGQLPQPVVGGLNRSLTWQETQPLWAGQSGPASKWILAEDSPLRSMGVDGVVPGPFGGNRPYVLSGLPPLPFITDYSIPATVTRESGLPIRIQAIAVE